MTDTSTPAPAPLDATLDPAADLDVLLDVWKGDLDANEAALAATRAELVAENKLTNRHLYEFGALSGEIARRRVATT